MRLAPCLLALVGAVYLVLVAVDSRPIADDWWFASVATHHSLWSTFHVYWSGETDRFVTLALTAVTLKLFGLTAVNVVPLAVLVLLWGGLTQATRLVASANRKAIGWPQATGIGLLAAVATVASAPGLFDTVGWFTSAASYLAGVAAAVWLAAWIATASAVRTWKHSVAAVVLGFIVSGFHELIGATIVIACVLVVICAAIESRGLRTGLNMARGPAAVGAGALTGLLVELIGPGTAGRATDQHAHIAMLSAIRTAGHTLSFVSDDFHTGIFALALAAGVIAFQSLGPAENSRSQYRLLGAIAFLLLIPWLVTSTMAAWGGSLEPDYQLPFRVAFLTTGSVSLALSLLVPATLYYVPNLLSQMRATLLALLFVTVGLIGFSHRASPIITAERMRAQVVARRSAAIRAGIAHHRATIVIQPAPLLTAFTQVYDLPFGNSALARTWNLRNLRAYFGVPGRSTLVALTRQPRNYCLAGVAASWVGVQSCQELHARR